MGASVYPIYPQRLALLAGVRTSIVVPHTARKVWVGNATTGDLRVYAAGSPAEGGFVIVNTGFDRPFEGSFLAPYVGFDVEADVAGTLVLTWEM